MPFRLLYDLLDCLKAAFFFNPFDDLTGLPRVISLQEFESNIETLLSKWPVTYLVGLDGSLSFRVCIVNVVLEISCHRNLVCLATALLNFLELFAGLLPGFQGLLAQAHQLTQTCVFLL